MNGFLRWLLVILNAGLIICAIGTDATMANSRPWPLAIAVALTVAAVGMLPYFWIKTRRAGGEHA